jgi:hypothetical protein
MHWLLSGAALLAIPLTILLIVELIQRRSTQSTSVPLPDHVPDKLPADGLANHQLPDPQHEKQDDQLQNNHYYHHDNQLPDKQQLQHSDQIIEKESCVASDSDQLTDRHSNQLSEVVPTMDPPNVLSNSHKQFLGENPTIPELS